MTIPDSHTAIARPSIAIAAALTPLLALLALFSSFGMPAVYVGGFSDGVSYLYMADVLRGVDSGIGLLHFRHAQFPPGYPAFLALLGAGTDDPSRALWGQAVLAALASLLIVLWSRSLLASWPAALLLAAVALLFPWQLPWAFEPSSEPLFVALLLLICWIAHGSAPHPRRILVLALLVGVLCLVRTAGAPAVIALLIWAHARGARPGVLLLAGLTSTAPGIAWQAYKQSQPFTASYLDSLPDLVSALATDPLGFLGTQVEAWSTGFSPTIVAMPWSLVAGMAVLALALPALWRRLRERCFDALFLALYLPAIALWPFPAEMPRLVGVTLPVLLPLATLGLVRLLHRASPHLASPTSATSALVLVLALCTAGWQPSLGRVLEAPRAEPLSGLVRSAGYILSADPTDLLETQHRTLMLLREARSLVPAEECIYSTSPSMTSLHVDRMTWMTPAQVVDEHGQLSALRCPWFLVSNQQTLQGGLPPLHPAGSDGGHLRPVLVSQDTDAQGQRRVHVALLRRREP